MDRSVLIYGLYLAVLLILVGGIAVTPHIAHSNEEDAAWLYDAFSVTCHQKISRSQCLFEGEGYYIADCTAQEGERVSYDQKDIRAEHDSHIGYKFPVCARDVGMYVALLLGALVYPFFRRLDSMYVYPAIYLVIGIVPFALDGTIQLLTSIFPDIIGVYESNNLTRLLTGGLAGFVASFYVIPILNNMFAKPEAVKPKKEVKAKKS